MSSSAARSVTRLIPKALKDSAINQMFSGGLSPNISTDWNADGTPHKNTLYNGHSFNMGGCMGCHGSQGQSPKGQAGDFSVILARGSVAQPEVPLATPGSPAARRAYRNRSLTQ